MLPKLSIFLLLLLGCHSSVVRPKSSPDLAPGPVVGAPQGQPGAAAAAPSPGVIGSSSGPEPRQTGGVGVNGVGVGGGSPGSLPGVSGVSGSSSVYPYAAMYQNSVYGSGPKATAAVGGGSGGFLSFLRPGASPGTGRRSSLTSKLRNFMSNIFKRGGSGESSPYLGSGSSYSFALRNPPFGYNPQTSSATGNGQAGLFSGSSPATSNLFGSASQYRPLSVYPGFDSSAAAAAAAAAASSGSGPSSGNIASLWNNYKQWASTVNQGAGMSSPLQGAGAAAAAANTANYAWSPPTGGHAASGGNSYAVGGGQNQYNGGGGGVGTGMNKYQGAASIQYPSIQPGTGGNGGGRGGYGNGNQRMGTSGHSVSVSSSMSAPVSGGGNSFKPVLSSYQDNRSSILNSNKPSS